MTTAMPNPVSKETAAEGRISFSAGTDRSDWQLAKVLATTMIRRPKSGFLSLWVLLYVPAMTALQEFEKGSLADWFVLLGTVLVVGLAPVYIVWSPSALRALSCSTTVIRQARLATGLLFGLFVLLMFAGILWWKIGPGPAEFWGPILIATLIQCAVYINGWREASKIEDFQSRQERLKNAQLQKEADRKSKRSTDIAGGNIVGENGMLGRVLSSGDPLLDEIALKSWIRGLKWFALPLVAVSFGFIFFTYLLNPDPHEPFAWGHWFVVMMVFNAPLLFASSYNSQIIHWLAFSGERTKWWRNHVKLTFARLWLGPLTLLGALGGYVLGLHLRNVEPVLTWSIYTVGGAVVIGLAGQLMLAGMANVLLVVANRLRGWKIGAAYFCLFAFAGMGIAGVGIFATQRADSVNAAADSALATDETLWTIGWLSGLLALLLAMVAWGLAVWGYRHLNVRGSSDIDFFGTSK